MKKGDILVINYKFDPIGRLLGREWGHCAWVLSEDHLLESTIWGIYIVPARKYIFNKNYKVKLLRLRNIKREDLKEAVECGVCYKEFILFNKKSSTSLIAECLSLVNYYFRKDKPAKKITLQEIIDSNLTESITGQI